MIDITWSYHGKTGGIMYLPCPNCGKTHGIGFSSDSSITNARHGHYPYYLMSGGSDETDISISGTITFLDHNVGLVQNGQFIPLT